MRSIVTVIGHDRVGIIASVSNLLAQYDECMARLKKAAGR